MLRPSHRRGAVVPMFAVILPVLLVLCAFAINLSFMRLTQTELKIATDAAARASGRAWSELQSQQAAIDFAIEAAAMNDVAGSPLTLSSNPADGDIEFGITTRDGEGRYVYSNLDDPNSATGPLPSAVRINAQHQTPLLFAIGDNELFTPAARSVVSQLDRDIALTIDRSGSMAYYLDEDAIYNRIVELFQSPTNFLFAPPLDNDGFISQGEATAATADYQGNGFLASLSLFDRRYSNDVLNQLEGDQKSYAQTYNSLYRTRTDAPELSRWAALEDAVEVFFDTLDRTENTEKVSVTSFSTDTRVDMALTTTLSDAENAILDIYPEGGTAIGDAILTAADTLYTSESRSQAAKTIIVFTDGLSNFGTDPLVAGQQLMEQYPNLVINTVTFSQAADQVTMEALANIGSGNHYHADSQTELVNIFRLLASSFRTIITE